MPEARISSEIQSFVFYALIRNLWQDNWIFNAQFYAGKAKAMDDLIRQRSCLPSSL